jgi:hypothetical protein
LPKNTFCWDSIFLVTVVDFILKSSEVFLVPRYLGRVLLRLVKNESGIDALVPIP